VVGVVVAGAAVVGSVTEGEVELPVVLLVAAGGPCRAVRGVEQPAAASATPTKRVSTQVADHLFHLSEGFTVWAQQRLPAGVAENQLASWTTSASPTLA
jgi:hypothetical protein